VINNSLVAALCAHETWIRNQADRKRL